MQKRSESRDLAIEQGQKTYIGNPCKKCGSEEKYVSSYSCVQCNIEKNSHKLYDDELMSKYRTNEKQNTKLKKWRFENSDALCKQNNKRRLSKYNISQEDFDILLQEQNGNCAICYNQLIGKFAIDHNHDNGKVRGLLCLKCNSGIGLLGDSPKLLMSAIDYLNERN